MKVPKSWRREASTFVREQADIAKLVQICSLRIQWQETQKCTDSKASVPRWMRTSVSFPICSDLAVLEFDTIVPLDNYYSTASQGSIPCSRTYWNMYTRSPIGTMLQCCKLQCQWDTQALTNTTHAKLVEGCVSVSIVFRFSVQTLDLQ
jgi:hypothetical protein